MAKGFYTIKPISGRNDAFNVWVEGDTVAVRAPDSSKAIVFSSREAAVSYMLIHRPGYELGDGQRMTTHNDWYTLRSFVDGDTLVKWDPYIFAIHSTLSDIDRSRVFDSEAAAIAFMDSNYPNLTRRESVDLNKVEELRTGIRNRLELVQLYVSCQAQVAKTYGEERQVEDDDTLRLLIEDVRSEIQNLQRRLDTV